MRLANQAVNVLMWGPHVPDTKEMVSEVFGLNS